MDEWKLGQMVGRTDESMDGVLYIDARTHLKEMGFIVDRSTDGSIDRQPLIFYMGE